MVEWYVLDADHSVRGPYDLMHPDVRAQWEDSASRRVAQTHVGEFYVSTVFLSLDHSWGNGPPLLFETMIFGYDSWDDLYECRYSTWDEAVAGHAAAVAEVIAHV